MLKTELDDISEMKKNSKWNVTLSRNECDPFKNEIKLIYQGPWDNEIIFPIF